MTINDQRRELAGQIVTHLRPHCIRIEIAGAIRRGQDTVRDIDIVCEPIYKPVTDMFGEVAVYSTFDFAASVMRLTHPPLELRAEKSGERYQKFTSVELNCTVDLFVVQPPRSWGALLAIRTGPADFSHLCVTSRLHGGAMPPGMQQREGRLWRGDQPIETDTEEAWFAALGLPYWEPSERTEARLKSWIQRKRERVGY